MEQKQFDTQSIIGFILIALIMLWLLYNNQPQENTQDKSTDNPVEHIQSNQKSGKKDIVTTNQDTDAPTKGSTINSGTPFSYIPAQVEPLADSTIIETQLAYYEFSHKGGLLSEIKLNNFHTYKNDSLYIIQNGNNDFNIQFTLKSGEIIDSRDLYFFPKIETLDGAPKRVTLRAYVSENQYLEFLYSFKPNHYLVDFYIKSNDMSALIIDSKPITLDWKLKGFRHAKSVEYENRYTMLTYEYETDKTSDLSVTSEHDEDEERNVDWVSYRQHFFNSILITDTPFKKATLTSENLVKDESEDVKYTKNFQTTVTLDLKQGEIMESLHWYFGPTDYKILKTYDDQYGISQSMPLGWGIFGWLNKYIFIPAFDFLVGIFPHGIAIIILTIIVRIIMSPVTYKSYLSQARMKVLRPEITEINEKYPGKEQAMKRQQETMALYRKAGVNPMSGCIPALLQLPIFYALFTFFPTAFVLRQKQFLWAEDLSSYDVVAHLPFNIPFYGNHISLFPILASIAIFIYMMMTTGQTMQQSQQPGMPNMKFMMYLSPVLMLFFFNNYASGLSLYYFISNLITILIMLVIKKYIIDEDRIHARIEQNKKKPKKGNRFQKKMQEMMEQAEKQKRNQRKR